jgi:arginase
MSRLRAKCPDCRTLTAVALDGDFECHSCGRSFRAGLVRVPRAWGAGGEEMAEAAFLTLPYPETGVVDEDTLAEQTLALAADLPARPLVMGGCCCSHVGAIEGLAARHRRLAVVWLDAHGDLNTAETSPSGNAWGMPLRMLIDDGALRVEDVLLVGARNLDEPEEEYIEAVELATRIEELDAVLADADAVYVAFDVDVLEPGGEATMFMPEPGGPTLADAEAILGRIASSAPVAGVGFTGATATPANVEPITRLAAALGL